MRPLALILLCAVCAPMAEAGPDLAACGADKLQDMLGRPLSELSLPADRMVRVIRPGEAVTMDYFPERLDIELDDQDTVIRVRCG